MILIGQGIPMVTDQVLMVGQWVAALSYVVLLQQPLVEISDRWNFFLAGLTSIDRIREIMREKPEREKTKQAERFSQLEFQDVSFRYPESQSDALKHVNLIIKRGDWIGVFGESGSGKSTLLQMLYGFYDPGFGRLLWNGTDFSDLSFASLRRHFGVVEQFPFLFSGTIRQNITLFEEFSLDERKLGQIFSGYPLIQSLLGMLDFEVSERGGNLSMGQKQMITFLRAFLAQPDIWILDEATAFFDQEAEQEVLRALAHLTSREITVVQVAHRPEALSQMKRVIQVQGGQVRDCLQNPSQMPPDLK